MDLTLSNFFFDIPIYTRIEIRCHLRPEIGKSYHNSAVYFKFGK